MPALRAPRFLGRPLGEWIGLVARLGLGGVLAVAGALKLGDLENSVLSVRNFQVLPFSLTSIVGYALPFIEVAAGLLLILGLLTRGAAFVGAGLMVAFIFGIASLWIRGIAIDCGCFGNGAARKELDPVAYALDILRDTVLLACGAWLLWRPRSAFALEDRLFPQPLPFADEVDGDTPYDEKEDAR